MATEEKCCCCALKTGCFILGYLHLFIVVSGIGISLVFMAMGVDLARSSHMNDANSFFVIGGVLLAFFLLGFTFCVVGLIGLHKNKMKHLKAYIIYNVVFFVITLILMFLQFITNTPGVALGGVYAIIIVSAPNLAFIIFSKKYYKKMKEEQRQRNNTTQMQNI